MGFALRKAGRIKKRQEKHVMKKLILLLLVLSLPTVRAAELPSIAVADFTSEIRSDLEWWKDLRHGLPDMISDALVNSKRFDVYEREKLNTIMREQGFQASGFADPQTAVALGKVAGVHYILTGKIIDYGREVRDFAGYGVRTRTSFYRLKAGIKVIDVQTGKVLFSRNDGAEEQVPESSGLYAADTTMASKLAEEVSAKLIKALFDDDMFQQHKESEVALLPVKVSSTPDHADVEVDGVFYGNAGGDIKLPTGLHMITISLPGYEKWSKKVLVQAGLSINAALTKKTDARIEMEVEHH
jgi:curli biogenesis system outer membrane secretion channel CsgG